MATVMLAGTLNRVMIVELGVPATMAGRGDGRAAGAGRAVPGAARLPVGHAPLCHRLEARVPYMWFGSLWQFGGFAIMPFALLVLVRRHGSTKFRMQAKILAALAFLMTGLGHAR
jgi:BCD family chlorophyll transporter-like MFS transporter